MRTTIQKLTRYPPVLKQFFEYPQRRFTPFELAKIVRMPYSTVWRYVQDLERGGVIHIERIGGYNVCRLNEKSPLIPELKHFIRLKISPHWLAIKQFIKKTKRLPGIKKIILFGSVAKGKEKLVSDIDIAVIAKKPYKKLEKKIIDVTDEILSSTRMRIVALVMTEAEAKKNRQFARELAKGRVLYARTERS